MPEKCPTTLLDARGRALAQTASVSYDFQDGYVIPEHFHPEHQLVYASAGVMTVYTRPGVWVVPPMRAVWIPAKTPHRIAMSGRVSMRTLYFLPELGRGLPAKYIVMNVTPLLREPEGSGAATADRDHSGPTGVGPLDSSPVAASVRCTRGSLSNSMPATGRLREIRGASSQRC
jgi:AraC-like ligand binding domain